MRLIERGWMPMLPQHTINGDSASLSLLEATSLLTTGSNAPELPGQLPLAFKWQPFPGQARGPFERKLRHTLHEQFHALLLTLPSPMQAHFPQLYNHAQKTFAYTLRMLRLLHLTEDEQTTIAIGAFFHDIGKLAIDEDLLNKPGPLTSEEYAIIKRHPAYGARILTSLTSLPDVALLAYHHHERWDREGYPDRLAGEAIPLGARMIAIADAFDAMTSNRTYQVRRSPQEALEELQRCAGTQFDPRLVQLFRASGFMPDHRTSTARSYPANH
jgi:HD-GYP domain-containing protein (c-di-GMP phosphodiesterase class II)